MVSSQSDEQQNQGQEDNEQFHFYLNFAKPLVFNLPNTNDRIKAAAWIRRLKDETDDKELATNYLKLLIFVLQRKKLVGPFTFVPIKEIALPPFPEEFNSEDASKNLAEIDKIIQQDSSDMDSFEIWPSYMVALSSDAKQYAATQEIPNFGIQVYWAISQDSTYTWDNADKAAIPIGEHQPLAKQEIEFLNHVSPNISSFVTEDQTREATSPRLRSTQDDDVLMRFDMIPPQKSCAEIESGDPLKLRNGISPTWGSNLVNVNEAPVLIQEPIEDTNDNLASDSIEDMSDMVCGITSTCREACLLKQKGIKPTTVCPCKINITNQCGTSGKNKSRSAAGCDKTGDLNLDNNSLSSSSLTSDNNKFGDRQQYLSNKLIVHQKEIFTQSNSYIDCDHYQYPYQFIRHSLDLERIQKSTPKIENTYNSLTCFDITIDTPEEIFESENLDDNTDVLQKYFDDELKFPSSNNQQRSTKIVWDKEVKASDVLSFPEIINRELDEFFDEFSQSIKKTCPPYSNKTVQEFSEEQAEKLKGLIENLLNEQCLSMNSQQSSVSNVSELTSKLESESKKQFEPESKSQPESKNDTENRPTEFKISVKPDPKMKCKFKFEPQYEYKSNLNLLSNTATKSISKLECKTDKDEFKCSDNIKPLEEFCCTDRSLENKELLEFKIKLIPCNESITNYKLVTEPMQRSSTDSNVFDYNDTQFSKCSSYTDSLRNIGKQHKNYLNDSLNLEERITTLEKKLFVKNTGPENKFNKKIPTKITSQNNRTFSLNMKQDVFDDNYDVEKSNLEDRLLTLERKLLCDKNELNPKHNYKFDETRKGKNLKSFKKPSCSKSNIYSTSSPLSIKSLITSSPYEQTCSDDEKNTLDLNAIEKRIALLEQKLCEMTVTKKKLPTKLEQCNPPVERQKKNISKVVSEKIKTFENDDYDLLESAVYNEDENPEERLAKPFTIRKLRNELDDTLENSNREIENIMNIQKTQAEWSKCKQEIEQQFINDMIQCQYLSQNKTTFEKSNDLNLESDDWSQRVNQKCDNPTFKKFPSDLSMYFESPPSDIFSRSIYSDTVPFEDEINAMPLPNYSSALKNLWTDEMTLRPAKFSKKSWVVRPTPNKPYKVTRSKQPELPSIEESILESLPETPPKPNFRKS